MISMYNYEKQYGMHHWVKVLLFTELNSLGTALNIAMRF